MVDENPYAAPQVVVSDDVFSAEIASRDQGIGRLIYIFIMLLILMMRLFVLIFINSGFFIVHGQMQMMLTFLTIFIVMVIQKVVVEKRLINVGSNPRWSWLVFVPIINLPVYVRCIICPPGFQQTRKLDLAGWLMVVPFAVILLLSLTMIGYYFISQFVIVI